MRKWKLDCTFYVALAFGYLFFFFYCYHSCHIFFSLFIIRRDGGLNVYLHTEKERNPRLCVDHEGYESLKGGGGDQERCMGRLCYPL